MLTGDQGLTAKQIGFSSGIISEVTGKSTLDPVIDINSTEELAEIANVPLEKAHNL